MSASSVARAIPGGNPDLDRFLNLKNWARETPGATVLAAPGFQTLSYSRLWTHVETTRAALRSFGLQPGDTVALVTRAGPESFSAFLAIAGEFACAPLNPAFTEIEFRTYLARLRARALLVQDGLAPQAVTIARELGMGVARISTQPHHAAGEFLVEPVEMPAPDRPACRDPIDAGLLLNTSSTTGYPKLVPLTRANLQALGRNSSRASQLGATDRLLNVMPMFHMQALSSSSAQVFAGGAVICTAGLQMENLEDWFEQFRPTWSSLNPAMTRVIVAHAREHAEFVHKSTFRFCRTSGAAADPELTRQFEELFGVQLLDGYAATEAPGIARWTLESRRTGSVGKSLGLEIAIMDESGVSLPPDTEGEIAVRGETVTSGYLDDPEANRIAFRNGWFHTGDYGRLDSDGFLYLTGRKKELINRGGQKIFPAEVDHALGNHPAVREAAAFAVPHPTLGEDLAAAVVLRDGAAASESELRRFLETQLAHFKIPRSIAFVESLPRTASGKLKRADLTEQHGSPRLNGITRPTEASPELQEVQARILDMWRRILETSEVGADDDFFLLGGDSLSAAVMLAELERSWNLGRGALVRVEIFDQLTVRSLATVMLDSTSLTAPADTSVPNNILPFQTGGSRIPFFCFPASSVDPYYLRHLAKSLGTDQPFYVVYPPDPVAGNRLVNMEARAAQAISAIRSVRPSGPYVIGGHCYGGVLAFETTRQLLAQGEQVTPLVLLDVPAPGYPKVARSWKRYLAESGRVLARWARRERAFETGELAKHLDRLKRLGARKFRGRAGRAFPSMGSRDSVAALGQYEVNSLALAEYVLKDFPAPILHFIAADEAVSTRVLDDPRYGWRDFARGGMDFRSVRGGHNSMLGAECAPALAAELRRLLKRVS